MQHTEYQIIIPASTAVQLCGDYRRRSSLRFKNGGTPTVYIGNGPGVTAANGYHLLPDTATGVQELHLALPWGDDTRQAYWGFNSSQDTAAVIEVMEHCCPKIELPSEF